MDHIITVENVWKEFTIPHEKRSTVLDHMASTLSVLEGKRFTYEKFWALKDISFSVDEGESLGIIGPNGSGKSTLLKIIAKIMRADRGRVTTSGLTVPILELGIGFHGDLTVKENIEIYGTIMGIPRAEIRKQSESILDFAELHKFEDSRLKRLSSGMQVRLAFAIAVRTDARVYLVDEALAVGDIKFQQKCLETFQEFRKQGKSIILVSHSPDLVKDFCEKTLYLRHGEARAFGPSEESVTQYVQDIASAN